MAISECGRSLYNIRLSLISTPYFISPCSDCAPKKPAPQALDDAAAKKLWDISASMVGLA